MKSHIIAIGNSQGVRIPKAFLEECGLRGEVDMEVFEGGLLIRKSHRPREGWAEAFRDMADSGDDEIIETSGSSAQRDWRW